MHGKIRDVMHITLEAQTMQHAVTLSKLNCNLDIKGKFKNNDLCKSRISAK